MPGWDEVISKHHLVEHSDQWEFWDAYFTDNPDALHRVLADLYQVTQSSRARPSSLEELWSLVTPSFSNEPFPAAVRTLLAGRSVRWLAGRIGISQPYLTRLLNGQKPVISIHDPKGSMLRIEVVAKALRVHPSHFAEWRRLWVMSLIDSAFESQPNLSIAFFQKFAGLQERPASPHHNAR